MKYLDAISLDIIDMMEDERRREMIVFAEGFFNAIREQAATSRLFNPLTFSDFVYQPTEPKTRLETKDKKVLVLTDTNDSTTNLGKMIERFKQSFADEIDVINLNDVDIRGACLGCMRCGYDYTCTYKDGFADFYNQRVRTADIIVAAFFFLFNLVGLPTYRPLFDKFLLAVSMGFNGITIWYAWNWS